MKTTMQSLFFKQFDEDSETGWAKEKSEWRVKDVLKDMRHTKDKDGNVIVKYDKINIAGVRVGEGECLLEDLPFHVEDNYGVLADFDYESCPICGKVFIREYLDSYVRSEDTDICYCCEEHLHQAEPDCEDFS